MRVAIFALMTAFVFSASGVLAEDGPKEWTFAGVTRADSVEIAARVEGAVVKVAVKQGDAVAKGDLLFEIDSRTYELDLVAAKAQVRVAQARLESAKVNAENAKRLVEKGFTSKEEASLSLTKVVEADAELAVARVALQRAELALSWTRVVAPIAGNVGRLQVVEGSVAAGGTPLTRVTAVDPIHVSFRVPEAVLLDLRKKKLADPEKLHVSVGFAGEDGFPHEARLDLIDPEVDSRTGSIRFQAALPNPDGVFLPGMTTHVHVVADAE